MGRHTDRDDDGSISDPDWAPPADWAPCENRPDPGSWDDPAIRDEPCEDG